MLAARIISALIGIPLLIFIVLQGDPYFLIALSFLTLLALSEFKNIISGIGQQGLLFPLLVGALLFPLQFLLKYKYILPFFFFYLLFCFCYYLIFYPRYSLDDLSITILGILYILGGFFHLLLLRQLSEGAWLVLYLFIVIWSTDTGAYFIGLTLGKHKLAPAISPKKTWEGFLGGLVTSFLAVYLFSLHFSLSNVLFYLTPLISCFGQLGDLFASSLKRFAHLKDFGQIIPGHGGVLDRFDSILWAAPLTYYLLITCERLL